MAAMSDFLEQKLLDHVFNKVAFTSPSNFIALFTTAPADSGGGVEVTGGNYSRVQVFENGNVSTPQWNLAIAEGGGGFVVDNLDDIDFPQATASWGTIVAVGVFDAASGGNLLMHGSLAVSKTIDVDDIFRFPAGDLDLIFR